MRNKGFVVTKHDITNTINEAMLREGWFDKWPKGEDPRVGGFKRMLTKVSKRDKELNKFCSAKGIEPGSDAYIILSSYLLSTAKTVNQLDEIRAMESEIGDPTVKKCCRNILDTYAHRNEFDVSYSILTQLGMGNKFIACNMWKLLTNENYKPKDERMPRLECRNDEFSGEMEVDGRNVMNECRYTPWSLLWLLANGGSGQLNEAKGKNRHGKKPKGRKPGTVNVQGQDGRIEELMRILKVNGKVQRKNARQYLSNLKNTNGEVFDQLYDVVRRNPASYDLSGGWDPVKVLDNTARNISARLAYQQQTQDNLGGQGQQQAQSQGDGEEQQQQAFNQSQSAESGNTGQGLNLITDDQVSDIIEKMDELCKLTRQYELELSRYRRGQRTSSSRSRLNENNTQTRQQNADIEQLVEEIKQKWGEAVGEYSKYFGPAVKYIFIYPDDMQYEIRELGKDTDTLEGEGGEWDSEELRPQEDLDDALEELKKKLDYKQQRNSDAADMISNISNGIIRALRA